MSRRLALLAFGAALIATASGCGGGSGGAPDKLPPVVRPVNHPAAVSLHAVPHHARWNVSVVVMNTADAPRTIHVDLNGKGAVDASFTASPGDRPWPYYFHVPTHRLAIHAVSSGGGHASRVTQVKGGNRVWFVVTDYQPLRLGVEVNAYKHEPAFG
jgi:predicted enzyme related to lactoylglutathione lyase